MIARWCSIFPQHRVVELAGAKHYIQEDSPAEIARAISEWSSETLAGR